MTKLPTFMIFTIIMESKSLQLTTQSIQFTKFVLTDSFVITNLRSQKITK